jgi:uncharacterized protein (DUF2249 family)
MSDVTEALARSWPLIEADIDRIQPARVPPSPLPPPKPKTVYDRIAALGVGERTTVFSSSYPSGLINHATRGRLGLWRATKIGEMNWAVERVR